MIRKVGNTRGSKRFAALMSVATAEAIQVAGAWLEQALKNAVSLNAGSLTAMGTHSAPGEMPYVQSGRGFRSIGHKNVPKGVQVGVTDMGIAILAGNYMAAWDSPGGIRHQRRPWMIWRKYQSTFARIVKSQLKLKLGVK